MLKIGWGGTGILHAISRRFAIIEEFCKSYLANALIIISEEINTIHRNDLLQLNCIFMQLEYKAYLV